ncbi:MAG: sulfatase [Rikenellaceae bacterium]
MESNLKFSIPAMAIAAMVGGAQMAQAANKSAKPNIIWYLIEDTSPQYLAMYNDGKGAPTPNLEAMSKDMIIYNNAFSNAPVSSAARTTLITGCYAPRFGGALHRRLEELKMPEGLRMVPSYLRDAGYYTCNVTKTDYNVELDKTAWDLQSNKYMEIDAWKRRKDKSQPFFFMRSHVGTHESKLLFNSTTYKTVKTKFDPEKTNIHPNLPATDLMKYTYATFYDRIEEADAEFGKLVEMLKAEGEFENTFIFFFGDNGGCVPQSKGYTKDVGFRVPLMVYVPQNWRDKIDNKVGTRTDDMVQFMDFGATAINLAGGSVPEQSNGVPFLGKNSSKRESILCYADRFDDFYSFNRSLYRGDFRYGRNFIPYHARGLHAYYRYRMLALEQARNMYKYGQLNELQSEFFEPIGAEELYDLKNDPNETKNLANDPKYKAQLLKMRKEMVEQMDNYCDLGFLPETVLNSDAMYNPDTYGFAHKSELSGYHRVANLQLEAYSPEVAKSLSAAITAEDDVQKWWGLTSAASFGEQSGANKDIVAQTRALTADYNRSFVRSRAYVAMANYGVKVLYNEAVLKSILAKCRNLGEVLVVLNDATYMHDTARLGAVRINVSDLPFTNSSAEERISYLRRNV